MIRRLPYGTGWTEASQPVILIIGTLPPVLPRLLVVAASAITAAAAGDAARASPAPR